MANLRYALLPASWLIAATLTCLLAACTTPGALPESKTPVIGSLNGIAVDPTDGSIYVGDDATHAVLVSRDLRGFRPFASIPVALGQASGISALAAPGDATVLVERFGFGTASAIFEIGHNGRVERQTSHNPQRRRLGLLPLSHDQWLSSWFVKPAVGADAAALPSAGVSLITSNAANQSTERDLIVGLGKPVGLAVVGDWLYVTDQQNNAIYRQSLAALLQSSAPALPGQAFLSIAAPDLMAASASGELFTKCGAHNVCRIAGDGKITSVAGGLEQPRGIAIDTTRKMLLIVDRGQAKTDKSFLVAVPLP